MAIDSRTKRASTIATSFYSLGPSVQPSGTFDAEQRRVVGYGYSGIAAGAPAAAQSFHIVEPFVVQFPDIRPVRVKPFDVLRFAWGGVQWMSSRLAFAS